MSGRYSVLRFKRKQQDSNDCPEIIAVQSKKPRVDGSENSTPIIFKYAGPVRDDSAIEKALQDVESPAARKKRPLTKSTANKPQSSVVKDDQAKYRSVSVSKKRKIGEDIELLDVDSSPPVDKSKETATTSGSTELLTCNGLKLVRDKLNISEQASSSSACYNSDGDDLYDLYYHCWSNEEPTASFDPLDILYVAPFDSDVLMEDSDENEGFEDSDSNDEDHWKNDYPDSPDSKEGSDAASLSSEDSFSQRTKAYRYRNWNANNGGIYVSDYDNTQYGFYHDDPTDFFERYSDHVQSDLSLSD